MRHGIEMRTAATGRQGGGRRAGLMVTGAAVISVILGSLLVTAAPASAGAYGCSWWGPGSYNGFSIGSGQYCVNIAGSGTFVANVGGGYVGNACNTQITAEFFDATGRWYRTFTSAVRWGCSPNVTQVIHLNRYVQRGTMCSTLRQNGGRLTSVCHRIY